MSAETVICGRGVGKRFGAVDALVSLDLEVRRVETPLSRSLISINPHNGLISDPIPLHANPAAGAMALSSNGRYLYVGLADSPEVHRTDLNASPLIHVRLSLGFNFGIGAIHALDIEVLDGDGSSFLIAGSDGTAIVFDGAIPRRERSGVDTPLRIERTGTPGVFIAAGRFNSEVRRLSVTSTGVAASETKSLHLTYNVDISGAGNLILASSGHLVDSANLAIKANYGLAGRPCLDLPNARAYLVNGIGVHGFRTDDAASTGVLALPTSSTGDWAQKCIRWGVDGFAILGDGKVYLARWSMADPASVDSDNDGIADTWETMNFGALNTDPAADTDRDGISDALEYVFGSSPLVGSVNPFELKAVSSGAVAVDQTTLRMVFPRRQRVGAGAYTYEISSDLTAWSTPRTVTESVLSTRMVDGDVFETVEALVESPKPDVGFVRLKWSQP